MSTSNSAPSQQKDVKITLYWLNQSRAHRILWLLEELKLEYELKVYKRGSDMLAPPELKEIHPLGKSPILGIQGPDMDKPRIIIESGVIVEYLIEHFGPSLIPRKYPEGREGQVGHETEEWLRWRTFSHYAEGSMMPPMLVSLVSKNIKNGPVPFFVKPVTRTIADRIDGGFLRSTWETHLGFLEEQIASSPNGGEFLCGTELSGGDIMMIFPLEAAQHRAGLTKDKYPKLSAYIDRLHERDAYKRAVERVEQATGEPYSGLL